MKYKGYEGTVTYDSENRIFHGEVPALPDVITFQGTSADELEKVFRCESQVLLEKIDKALDFDTTDFPLLEAELDRLIDAGIKDLKDGRVYNSDEFWKAMKAVTAG